MSAHLERVFTRRGMTIRTGVTVRSVAPGAGGMTVELESDGKRDTVTAEQVLVAVGRAARTRGIGLEALGVEMERGFVKVGPTMETSIEGLYIKGGWRTGGFKATPVSDFCFAHTITKDQPHPLTAPFNLDLFSGGRLIDETAAAAIAH